MFSVLVNRLLYKHAPLFIGRLIKMLPLPPFCMDSTRKAIAVNSLIIVSCNSSLKRVKTCSVRTLSRIYQGINEYYVMLFSYSIYINKLSLLAYTAIFKTFVSM